MLKAIGISKIYKDKVALNDVSLTFPDKGLVIIKGESGSGKSTLLNLLTALDSPTSGKIEFDGIEITPKNSQDFRRKYCGNIYQDYMLIEGLSAGENIALGLQASGKTYNLDDIKALLQKVGITEGYIDKSVSKLSGGEKQRVSIARAIAKEDAMIFADEPTGNLDSKNGIKIMDLLKEISKDRLVIVVSHNENYNTIYADYTIQLFDGIIKYCDLPCDNEPTQVLQSNSSGNFECKSKLNTKTIARLALFGFNKNKSKIIASIVVLIMISILSIVFTIAVIGDMPYSYACSINNSKNKNVMVFGSSFLKINKGSALNFQSKISVECSPVFDFLINSGTFAEDENGLQEYYQKYNIVPQISFGMAYNENMGIASDILYGKAPTESNEVMLPYCYAQYMAKVCLDYKVDDVKNLIGRDVKLYENDFKICGIFEEGKYFTDYNDAREASEFFVITNKMAQCIILAPQMDEFLYEISSKQNMFGGGANGFYFNMQNVKDIYGALRKIESTGKKLGFWNSMTLYNESIYCTSEIQSICYNYRYIAFLPLMIISFLGLMAVEYVSLSYLVSAKAKSYNILRSLGLDKKHIMLILFVQVFTIIIVQCVLGISLSALCCHIFGKVYVGIWTKGVFTKISTEVILPIGYIAPIILVFVSMLIGGLIVFAKTRSLFAKSIIENKTN